MAFKEWEIGSANLETAKILADECEADPFTALIAVSRGICDPGDFELMMSNEPVLCDPRELADITVASDFLNRAIAENKKIAVFGDYDCDGVTATAIMSDYLIGRGADLITYIPDRIKEGYGMSKEAVLSLYNKGVEVIITVDNGISCIEEIEYAKTLGIDVVVTDHHIPGDILPEAIAVVDPHRKDCGSAFKEICGAQVAFGLICVMEDKEPEQLLGRFGDLLAIAVVGDVMPLVDQNRSIVKYGISLIKNKPRVGISAIINTAGIDRNTLNASKISFGIVPRINTSGRMANADIALELLLSEDMMSALKIANKLEDLNALRQKTEKDIMSEAISQIERKGYNHNRVIVVSGEGWHMGVVGIVASRICERYSKPAVVLSVNEDIAHGSGRSYEGFNLYEAIYACRNTLEKYGGHNLAAGVSLKTENIDAFRKAINDFALGFKYRAPILKLDLKLNPSALSIDMVYAIKSLEPFGLGNPVPQFGIFGVRLERITELSGGKHLKLMFSKGEVFFQALLFSVTKDKFCFDTGDICDIAVCLDENQYKGNSMLSVQIKAIRMSSSYEEVEKEISVLDDFISGYNQNTEVLLPLREEIADVYKKILSSPMLEKRLEYIFINNIGYAKTKVALKVLSELNLISLHNGIYSVMPQDKKRDLMLSPTFRKLSGGDGN